MVSHDTTGSDFCIALAHRQHSPGIRGDFQVILKVPLSCFAGSKIVLAAPKIGRSQATGGMLWRTARKLKSSL